jgi:hypothetical protein
VGVSAAYHSYAEQAAHYFGRPHEALPDAPLATAAAWRGEALAESGEWSVALTAAQVAEIEAANQGAAALPLEALTPDDFPLPGLAAQIADWRRELQTGRGFLRLSGVPVARWSREQSERFFWALGLHLGRPGAQNPQGDLLGHVLDTGDDAADPLVRLYRTRSNIAYHCDAADAVGLLCLHPARRGGASRIASSVTVFNELLARRPDLARRLFEAVPHDLRNEERPGMQGWIPIVPCRHAAGVLRTFYHSDYFRSAVRHPEAREETGRALEVLDLYDEIAATPGVYLDMELAAGDIQLLSNHTVIHARTAYEDFPEPERKRHLLRLWLSL